MKKQLNVTSIANELKNGSRFFAPQADNDGESAPPETKNHQKEDNEISVQPEPSTLASQPPVNRPTGESTPQSSGESAEQSAAQPIHLSTTESTDESSVNRYDESPILGRPKSFYISHQQDKDLDLAVAKLASGEYGPTTQKMDRSSLLRLILEEMDITGERTLQRLHQRHVDRQLYQLNSQRHSRQRS